MVLLLGSNPQESPAGAAGEQRTSIASPAHSRWGMDQLPPTRHRWTTTTTTTKPTTRLGAEVVVERRNASGGCDLSEKDVASALSRINTSECRSMVTTA